MLRTIQLFTLLLLHISCLAQWSGSVGYQATDYVKWQGQVPQKNGSIGTTGNSITLGIMKDIQPNRESQRFIVFGVDFLTSIGSAAITSHELRLKTGYHFYPFNMDGDCDCPSFYQQGTWFSRGFRLGLNAGLGLTKFKAQSISPNGIFEVEASVELEPISRAKLAPFIRLVFGTPVRNDAIIESLNSSTLNGLVVGVKCSLVDAGRGKR